MSNHQQRYDNWAPSYNADVAARRYEAPQTLVAHLMDLIEQGKVKLAPTPRAERDRSRLRLRPGGPGASRARLRPHRRHRPVPRHARAGACASGAYRTLIPWQDLNHPLPFFLHGQYDLTICCGVFALDFVEPRSLRWLAQVTKPGGTLIMTTKTHYHRDYDFDGYSDALIEAGELTLVDCRRDQPYLGDEADGHYWVFSTPSAAAGQLTCPSSACF
jgi:hypothetical protein